MAPAIGLDLHPSVDASIPICTARAQSPPAPTRVPQIRSPFTHPPVIEPIALVPYGPFANISKGAAALNVNSSSNSITYSPPRPDG